MLLLLLFIVFIVIFVFVYSFYQPAGSTGRSIAFFFVIDIDIIITIFFLLFIIFYNLYLFILNQCSRVMMMTHL